MKNYTDEELAELADYSERNEREALNPDAKKAFAALRQGADWLIRFRIKERKAIQESSVKSTKGTTQ